MEPGIGDAVVPSCAADALTEGTPPGVAALLVAEELGGAAELFAAGAEDAPGKREATLAI